MFVYLVTNTINGKRYIGQTSKSLGWRWWRHCNDNHCAHLHRAILKHGKDNFTIEPLLEVPTRALANEFEAEYIKRYCTFSPDGYNLTTGGDSFDMSDATKQKMSQSQKGRRPPSSFSENWTPEDRQKARERMMGNKHLLGYSPSEETRRKISESMKKARADRFWSTAQKAA